MLVITLTSCCWQLEAKCMIFGASGGFETIFKLTSHPEVIVIPLVWLLTLRRVRHLLYVNLLQSMRSTLYRAKTEMGAALNHFNRLVSSCWAVIKLNVMFCILVLLATQRFFSFAFWCQSWRIEMHRLASFCECCECRVVREALQR